MSLRIRFVFVLSAANTISFLYLQTSNKDVWKITSKKFEGFGINSIREARDGDIDVPPVEISFQIFFARLHST